MAIEQGDRVRCPSGLFGRVDSLRDGRAVVMYETTPSWQPGTAGDLRGMRATVADKRTTIVKVDLLRPA